ncbi:S41 family peptidase [Peribacillus loiseleuriae]|uniref:lmo1851 family serine protease n=1 Tax=Peribacillus loiseleuriae TaxID=1679170 RepID=UPI003CFBD7B9
MKVQPESGEHALEEENKQTDSPEKTRYVKMRRFPFIMGIFLLVFLTAGITTIALTFGTDKVESSLPSQMSSGEHPEFAKLYSTYDTLKNKFYQDVNETDLVNGAIDGMIKALDDPYSTYMNQEEAKSFQESISSSFEGIGAEIQQANSFIKVVSPIKGSPAEKAGIKPNDLILSVNGASLEGVNSTEAVMKIRGKKGTKVDLEISREGSEKPIEITITRDTIPVETVYAEMLDNHIAKIQVTSFSTDTANELKQAITEMDKQGMKGMILDLRGNPGGLLDQAEEIASIFVPNGKPILQVENRTGEKQVANARNNGVFEKPVVVLIDGGSASASEIVAAAVRESAGIKLIGEKSFGKGTVQTATDFKDGSNFKFTAAKWLTPNGNWIHSKGIEPDVLVKLPDYASLTYISPEKELKVSESGVEVKTAEKMLEAAGYKPGKIDGFYDDETEKAVSQFQKDHSIKVTGILTGESTTKLMQALREKILANDTQLKKASEVLESQLNTSK